VAGGDGGARREPATEALERRYRRLLAWYPAAYRAANADDMLGVALARSGSGQRWPEPGEAVNLIVSGVGERLGGMLRQPDHSGKTWCWYQSSAWSPASPACGSTNACAVAASLKRPPAEPALA